MRGGDKPLKKDIKVARELRNALDEHIECQVSGRLTPDKNIIRALIVGYDAAQTLVLTGNPNQDWGAVHAILQDSACQRLRKAAEEARNIRLLDRGTQLRDNLSRCWRNFGNYKGALSIIRQSFIQEHFSRTAKPETGVIVMNMHKAKGKQFDEVIIFEGWPVFGKGPIPYNPNRIVPFNSPQGNLNQARQNFRVSITRSKIRTTIMTPKSDPCILLPKQQLIS